MERLGPWFYYGSCAGCGADIEPDDEIRADGDGGYLCEDCGRDAEEEQ
jgi:DNA-directed RNA polymerase subunit RPC12/RpoP